VVSNPIEKYESKWETSPDRGENKKTCETTTQVIMAVSLNCNAKEMT